MPTKKLTHRDDTFIGSDRDDVIYGLGGDDSIWGANGDDEIHGGDGNDILRAGYGNDKLFGDAGNDILTVYTGTERCDGGSGVDLIDFYFASNSLNVNLADHLAKYTVEGHVWQVSFTSVEVVYGSPQDDIITGDAKDNILYGALGDDKLSGKGGNDFIASDGGNEVMAGGAGKDMFVFAGKPDKKENFDRITDFDDGADRLALNGDVFAIHGGGKPVHYGYIEYQHLDQTEFQSGKGHVANDEDTRVIYDRSNGILYYDKNGSHTGGLSEVADIGKGLELSADSVFVASSFS